LPSGRRREGCSPRRFRSARHSELGRVIADGPDRRGKNRLPWASIAGHSRQPQACIRHQASTYDESYAPHSAHKTNLPILTQPSSVRLRRHSPTCPEALPMVALLIILHRPGIPRKSARGCWSHASRPVRQGSPSYPGSFPCRLDLPIHRVRRHLDASRPGRSDRADDRRHDPFAWRVSTPTGFRDLHGWLVCRW
jgi:hypothetical protein